MTKDYVIGVDASTSACKAIVWDMNGNRVAEGRAEIPLLRSKSDWHEQSAEDWWAGMQIALRTALNGIDLKNLAGLCICPQRETFVPVDESGNPQRNAILWMDVRARSLMPDIECAIGGGYFHELTGKPLSGNLTGLKILWLRENEPDTFKLTSKFLDVAAYLNHQLTGEYGTGHGIADPTGLFDMKGNCWAEEVIGYLGVKVEQMPVAYPAGQVIGLVTEAAASKCGLPVGLPVIAGLGDGQAGGLGVDITRPGDCYLSLGTSVVSGTFTERFVTNQAFRTMYAGIPDAFSLETVILGGTYTIDWFLLNFAGGLSIHQLEDEIRGMPPGSEGLMLVPYWNSALNPYWDPAARGIVIGWSGHHTSGHLYRAILEGIAFELLVHFEGVESVLGSPIERLVLMGGGSKSGLWCQMIADVTGKTTHRSTTQEATALGAGILAAYGAGLFEDIFGAARAMCSKGVECFKPDPINHHKYSRLYREVYRGLFPAVQPFVNRLTEITAGK
jgi:xylulokinase